MTTRDELVEVVARVIFSNEEPDMEWQATTPRHRDLCRQLAVKTLNAINSAGVAIVDERLIMGAVESAMRTGMRTGFDLARRGLPYDSQYVTSIRKTLSDSHKAMLKAGEIKP